MFKVDIFSGIGDLEEGLNRIEREEHGDIMQILAHTISAIEFRAQYTVIYRVKDNDGH